jgi:hypothetical protein
MSVAFLFFESYFGYSRGIAPVLQPICNTTDSTTYELHLLRVGTDGSSADTSVQQGQRTSSFTYGRTLDTNPYGGFWTYTQTTSPGTRAGTGMTDWNRGLITIGTCMFSRTATRRFWNPKIFTVT